MIALWSIAHEGVKIQAVVNIAFEYCFHYTSQLTSFLHKYIKWKGLEKKDERNILFRDYSHFEPSPLQGGISFPGMDLVGRLKIPILNKGELKIRHLIGRGIRYCFIQARKFLKCAK